MYKDLMKEMPSLFALEVTGSAMEPTILEGDELWVDAKQMPRSNGTDLAVLKIGEEHHVCRFTRFGSQIIMIHDNAPIAVVRGENVRIVGKVVGGTYTTKNRSAANTAVSIAD